MLRFLALILLLVNAVYFVWSEGKLPGFSPEQQTEPQRMGQQLKPGAIRLLTASEVRQLEGEPVVAKVNQCLQAGPFDEAQGTLLRPVLESILPSDSWTLIPVMVAERWIVYMGKYASPEALAKKRAELASFDLRFEPLQNPALQPGLSLGAYETQAAANGALDKLSRRGIRTARVLQERAEVRGIMLRLTGNNEAMRVDLNTLRPALGDKDLVPCR